jgi:hypothetical protein
VHQNKEKAIAFGLASSCILEAVLLDSSLREAMDKYAAEGKDGSHDVAEAFALVKTSADSSESLEELLIQLSHAKMKDSPDSPFYNLATRICALPSSLQALSLSCSLYAGNSREYSSVQRYL